jgi:3-hydroxymyristoyl/3-hydroxydecanoyl-(acyl carrier protein) dehydratase
MNRLREQIRTMLRVEPRDGGFRAMFNVGADLIVLPDHFRDHPILPGICMVQAILLAGAANVGAAELRLHLLKNAKLMQPVEPGDEVIIDADMTPGDGGDFAIKAKLLVNGSRRAEFSLVARLPARAEGAIA